MNRSAFLPITANLAIALLTLACTPSDRFIDGGTRNDPDGKIPVCISPDRTEAAFIEETFRLLNAYRADNKLPALTYDKKLEAAVQAHCMHMAAHPFFGHFAPEPAVKRPEMRAAFCDVVANGENLAMGASTPAEAMANWKSSPSHNKNMLSARYHRVGIGHFKKYAGQLFGE